MPPQQAYGLLDFIYDRFRFGAHRIPLCFSETARLPSGAPGRELERDISRGAGHCKPAIESRSAADDVPLAQRKSVKAARAHSHRLLRGG